jgi:G3E family GTPase
MNVWELLNGCICCTLSADLVSTLKQLDSDYSLDLTIVEPSGAADPKSILSALPYYKGTPLESIQTVSVLDPLRLEMLIEVMTPLIVSQIKHADLILISKCDQANSEEIAFARQVAQEHNPNAKVMDFSKDSPVNALVKEIAPWMN